MKTVAVASSSWPRVEEAVAIGGVESDSCFSVVLCELQQKKRKPNIVNFAIRDCGVCETDKLFAGCELSFFKC